MLTRPCASSDFQNPKLFDKDRLDPSKPELGGPATNVPDNQDTDVKHISPNPVEPSNILLQRFPPPITDSVKPVIQTLNTYAFVIMAGLGVVWFFVAFGSGWKAFIFRTWIIAGFAIAVFLAHGILGRKIEKEVERIRLDLMKQRGETVSRLSRGRACLAESDSAMVRLCADLALFSRMLQHSPPAVESVEWLNAFSSVVWPLINPSMFASIVDMIEDVMQASLPGFVDAVKVDDFTIGKNALRIVSMRALPDQPHEKEYPREEWIDQGSREDALDPKRRTSEQKEKDKQEAVEQGNLPEDEDQTGDYVNFEISFAYFAPPGTKQLQNENISLIINFFLGSHDWFHLPIPLWIAVESIVRLLVPSLVLCRN